MSLVAVVASAALTFGLLASPAGASAKIAMSPTSRDQQRLAAAAKETSGESSCHPPSGESVQSANSVEIDSAGEGVNVGLELLKLLGEGAFHFGEDEGLGWLLSIIGGEQPSLDPAEIDHQFDQVNTKLDALAQQQYDDCTAVLATLAQLKTGVDKDAYSNQVTSMALQIGLIETYEQDYQAIVVALGQNGGHVDALSSSLKDDMRDMLAGGQTGLRYIVNTVNVLESEDQPGAKAMVSLFSQILTDELGYDPYRTHIFPAAYVNAAAAQQDYYAAIVAQAVYLYSNVAHLDFTDGTYTHDAESDQVASLVNLAQKDVQSWNVRFADGPLGDGTPQWVSQGKSQGIGSIPANTVLDYRVQNQPMLWTDGPVGLNGDPSSPAPYYCGTTAPYCYADQYDAAGHVASTALVPSSSQPLAAVVAGQDYDGLSDWRIPTSADWAALQAGAKDGLSAWAAAHQLGGIFAAEKLTSHYGGFDQSLTSIAPMLVNTGTSASPVYGVLSSAVPSANALTLEKSNLGPLSKSNPAGRLVLTTDYKPTVPPEPFTDTTSAAQVTGSRTDRVRPTRPSAGSRVAAKTVADATTPVTFSTPTTCLDATTYTVPANVGSVRITATGGAGGAGEVQNQAKSPGGVGGVVTETVPVTAGTTLYVQVGGAGSAGSSRAGGIAGGGTGGISRSAKPTSGDYSGGGGGASGVSTTPDCSHWLAVAGGGGGGGAGLEAGKSPEYDGGRGGNGCAGTSIVCQAAADGAQSPLVKVWAGRAGGAAPSNRGGDTGHDTSGHAYGTVGADGSTMQGGNGGTQNSADIGGGGGGGGGGYFGGGGGGGPGFEAAGGGGGGGASFAVPGATSVSYGLGQAGQNGSVTITPVLKSPPPITVSASPANIAWDQPLPITFTATVPVDVTGTMEFSIKGSDQPVGTAPIRHGVATLTSLPIAPKVGNDDVRVRYSGDDHYLQVSSDTAPFVVTKQTPTLRLTVSGTVLKSGQAPTSLVVQMSPYAAGSVDFYDDINGGCEGKTAAGAACQNLGTADNVHGYASLTKLAVPLTPGKNYLHAAYAGDSQFGSYSEFNPAISNEVPVTVAS